MECDLDKNPDVSIILVNYNTQQLTKNCLTSIYEKVTDLNFDVWVVDNNSNDGSCEIIEKEFPQVNLIKLDRNSGFGPANNIAIKKSSAKYVLLLNTDTVLVNNAPKILFDFMEAHPEAGACGGNLYDENMNNVHSYGHQQTLKYKVINSLHISSLFPSEHKKILDKGHNVENEQKKVDIIVGADLMMKKTVLDKTGLFDEDFFMYWEESELQYRIKKHGYSIYIVPDAKIKHLELGSCKNRSDRREIILKNEYLYYKKCFGISKSSPIMIIFLISHLHRLISNPAMIFRVWQFILSN